MHVAVRPGDPYDDGMIFARRWLLLPIVVVVVGLPFGACTSFGGEFESPDAQPLPTTTAPSTALPGEDASSPSVDSGVPPRPLPDGGRPDASVRGCTGTRTFAQGFEASSLSPFTLKAGSPAAQFGARAGFSGQALVLAVPPNTTAAAMITASTPVPSGTAFCLEARVAVDIDLSATLNPVEIARLRIGTETARVVLNASGFVFSATSDTMSSTISVDARVPRHWMFVGTGTKLTFAIDGVSTTGLTVPDVATTALTIDLGLDPGGLSAPGTRLTVLDDLAGTTP